MERGAQRGMQAEQTRRKGFLPSQQRLSHHLPPPRGPGQGEEPQVTRFGICPICLSPLSSPFHAGPHAAAWLRVESWAQKVATPGPPERGSRALAGRPPGTRSLGLSDPDTCGPGEASEATPCCPAHRGPGYKQPAWGWAPHVGRAQAQAPALKWQQPQAFLCPQPRRGLHTLRMPIRLHTPERGFGKRNNQHFGARLQP